MNRGCARVLHQHDRVPLENQHNCGARGYSAGGLEVRCGRALRQFRNARPEAAHSVLDSGNEVLLLFGEHRAGKPPDRKYSRAGGWISSLTAC